MLIVRPIKIAPDPKGNEREWMFSLNHCAQTILDLEEISKAPGWTVLVQGEETAKRLVALAWAASGSFRAKKMPELTFEQFKTQGYLPEYLSDEWLEFQDAINNLVKETFPKAAGTRIQVQTLTAAMIMSSLGNTAELIGTSEST